MCLRIYLHFELEKEEEEVEVIKALTWAESLSEILKLVYETS